MAVEAGTVVARIGADHRQLTRGLRSATSEIRRFKQTTTNAFRSVQVAAAGIGIGLGVAAAFRKMTQAGVEFERSMATVGGVMRATREQMVDLTAVARQMGETTEFTANQAGQGLLFLGRAGFDAQKAIAVLPGTLDLATAAGIGLGRASDIATNALAAMRLEMGTMTEATSSMERVADTFIATITRSNTDMEQLAEAFKFGAPAAAAFGVSIEQLSAMIGQLGNAGIQGSNAGTQLQQAMIKASKAAREMGIESRDLLDVLDAMKQRGATADDILDVFGLRGGRAALVLSELTDETRRFAAILELAKGEASTLAGVMRNTLKGSFDTLRSAIESAGLDAFARYSGSLKNAVDRTTDFVRKNKEAFADFVSVARVAMESFKNVVVTAFEEVKRVLSTVFSPLKDQIDRVFASLGTDLPSPDIAPWITFITTVEAAVRNATSVAASLALASGTVIKLVAEQAADSFDLVSKFIQDRTTVLLADINNVARRTLAAFVGPNSFPPSEEGPAARARLTETADQLKNNFVDLGSELRRIIDEAVQEGLSGGLKDADIKALIEERLRSAQNVSFVAEVPFRLSDDAKLLVKEFEDKVLSPIRALAQVGLAINLDVSAFDKLPAAMAVLSDSTREAFDVQVMRDFARESVQELRKVADEMRNIASARIDTLKALLSEGFDDSGIRARFEDARRLQIESQAQALRDTGIGTEAADFITAQRLEALNIDEEIRQVQEGARETQDAMRTVGDVLGSFSDLAFAISGRIDSAFARVISALRGLLEFARSINDLRNIVSAGRGGGGGGGGGGDLIGDFPGDSSVRNGIIQVRPVKIESLGKQGQQDFQTIFNAATVSSQTAGVIQGTSIETSNLPDFRSAFGALKTQPVKIESLGKQGQQDFQTIFNAAASFAALIPGVGLPIAGIIKGAGSFIDLFLRRKNRQPQDLRPILDAEREGLRNEFFRSALTGTDLVSGHVPVVPVLPVALQPIISGRFANQDLITGRVDLRPEIEHGEPSISQRDAERRARGVVLRDQNITIHAMDAQSYLGFRSGFAQRDADDFAVRSGKMR